MRKLAQYDELTRRQKQRMATVLVLRSVVTVVVLVAAYFLLPLKRPAGTGIIVLVVGVLTMGLVLAWQIRAIVGSPFPAASGLRDVDRRGAAAADHLRRRLLPDLPG